MIFGSHTDPDVAYVPIHKVEPGDMMYDYDGKFHLIISIRSGEYRGAKRVFVSYIEHGVVLETLFIPTTHIHVRRMNNEQ
jgi:hypothetical protein